MCFQLYVRVLLLFCIAAAVTFAQEYELVYVTKPITEIVYDTTFTPRDVNNFKIPVIYYDYHVDGSNPDFGYRATSRWDQTGLEYANLSGWVDTTLSPDNMSPQRHPALTDTFLDISWNINRLFEPWAEGTTDTFTLKFPPEILDTLVDTLIISADTSYNVTTVYEIDTVYNPDSTFVLDTLSSRTDSAMTISADTLTSIVLYDTVPVPDTIMISDTMFKNIEIPDSLVAYWIPNEITYDDTTDTMWTFGSRQKMDPINGLGFGNESDSITNAGYTLRIHNQFTYTGGEKLYFGADDDFYVFINSRLIIECGGFHEAIIDSLYLDSLFLQDSTPLTVGETYDIDIFMVERRQSGNIFLAGLSEFSEKSEVAIDTFYDTLITYHIDTIGIDTIRIDTILDVVTPFKKSLQQTLLGLTIPPSSKYVTFEYFSINGAKVLDRKLPLILALSNTTAVLPSGMYVLRINFLNRRGERLSRPVSRKITVRR